MFAEGLSRRKRGTNYPSKIRIHFICYLPSTIPGDTATACCSTHLIDGGGTFNATGLDRFMKEVKIGECRLSYVVASIMGPQSSGKSTFLNHLFHTNLREMDAFKGRSQITKGIWMARCGGIEPWAIVIYLEATDGSERGEVVF